jgi:hypothetical protein
MRNFEKKIRKYIYSAYINKYEADLADKILKKNKILSKELINNLLDSDTENFKRLLNEGVSQAKKKLAIQNSNNFGYFDLIKAFADPNEKFQSRF